MNFLTSPPRRSYYLLLYSISIFSRFNHSNSSFSITPTHYCKRKPPQYATRPTFFSPTTSLYIYDANVKIASLGHQRKVEEARKLFDEMPQRDNVTYASMISIYLKNGGLSNAEKIFKAMPESNVVAGSAMIDGYAKVKRMDDARKVFDEMPHRNVVSWTSLINGYLGIGQIEEARRLFDQMPGKNVVSWTMMILGYARNGLIGVAKELFGRMPEKNVVTWTSMVKSLVENNEIDEARKLFDEMPVKNAYSWNIMISGYLDEKKVGEAVQLFNSMSQRDEISWTIMVTGLARNGMTENAREYFDQMPKKDITAWNAMITAYTNNDLMTEASEIFNLMPERNTVSWNAIIDGYSRNGPEHEALMHLIFMFRAGNRPDITTISSVVPASESRLELMQVHTLAILLGFESETSLANSLITMYARSGDITCACNVFENLKMKDVISWTAMILAHSNHGYGQHSLQAFARMVRSGTKPDSITFVGVLSACSHAGLVEKGKNLFNSMSRAYGLEPRQEHYSCLVDLLGRMGHVNEALEVVNQMPVSMRDATVLGALLGACKLHGNIEVANQIGADLIEMEPSSSGSYMLLGNLYAECGKWDDFARVRKQMKEMKVKKLAGCSQIEVENRSHSFFSGDRSHPQVEQIYDMLQEKLLTQMKELGYVERNPFLLV